MLLNIRILNIFLLLNIEDITAQYDEGLITYNLI